MNEKNTVVNLNLNSLELLAPLTAATLQNTLCLEELIALQKGQTFDRNAVIDSTINNWMTFTKLIAEKARKLSCE